MFNHDTTGWVSKYFNTCKSEMANWSVTGELIPNDSLASQQVVGRIIAYQANDE